jgi:hypothetical protein
VKTPPRLDLDDAAIAQLRDDVADLITIALGDIGYDLERYDDGTRLLPALEVVDPISRARVVVHVGSVIA